MIWALIVCVSYDTLCRLVTFSKPAMFKELWSWEHSAARMDSLSLSAPHGCKQSALSVAQRPVVVGAVSLDVDPTDALAKLRAPRPLLLFAVRAAVGVAAARGLQQALVWQRHDLIEQAVESLLVDASFRKLHLREEGTAELPLGAAFGALGWIATPQQSSNVFQVSISEPGCERGLSLSASPWSASSQWRTRWRCSRPRPVCGLGRRRTSSKSPPRSHL